MNTPLIAALCIQNIKRAIEKRAYSFAMEFVLNPLTREIVLLRDMLSPIWNTISGLNIDLSGSPLEIAMDIYYKCKDKLKDMRKDDKNTEDSKLTNVIRFLLNNRSYENDDGQT